jgi:hypothetical protein
MCSVDTRPEHNTPTGAGNNCVARSALIQEATPGGACLLAARRTDTGICISMHVHACYSPCAAVLTDALPLVYRHIVIAVFRQVLRLVMMQVSKRIARAGETALGPQANTDAGAGTG